MAVLADLNALVAEGIITPAQAQVIRARARVAMLNLLVRGLLSCGVIAVATGFVALLGDPLHIAIAGVGFIALGALVLRSGGAMWRMFGHAAALIGTGMLIGGGVPELYDRVEQPDAGLALALLSLLLALPALALWKQGAQSFRFMAGSLLITGVVLHLGGLYSTLVEFNLNGFWALALSLYASAWLLGLGIFLNLRFVTAFAILPLAQVPEIGTDYLNNLWAFFSPEPTISILWMALLAFLALRVLPRDERQARHGETLALAAFASACCAFFVASFDGDWPGESYRLGAVADRNLPSFSYETLNSTRYLWRETALHIPSEAFAIVWALALIATAALAARTLHRGIFNLAVGFLVVHFYAQQFVRFGDEPLAWIIAGLSAIPLAWVIWRLNQQFG